MQENNKITTILIFTIIFTVSSLLCEVKSACSLPADDVIPLVNEEYFPEVHKAFTNAKKRDILERKSKYAYDLLLSAGAPVFYDSENRVTHSKVMVIDKYITIVGSTNWTYSALKKNHESSVTIKSRDVALAFEQKLKKIEKYQLSSVIITA